MAAMLEDPTNVWPVLQREVQGVLLLGFATSFIVWQLLRERRLRLVWSVLAFVVTLAFQVGAIFLASSLGLGTR